MSFKFHRESGDYGGLTGAGGSQPQDDLSDRPANLSTAK